MDVQKLKFANSVVLSLVQTANNLIKMGDKFFKPYNITATQYNVLTILKGSGRKINQQELSSQLVVTRSDITGIVDRLEKWGYVKRGAHGHDRRVKLLQITKSGLDLIDQVENKYFKRVEDFIVELSAADLKHLNESIGKINKKLVNDEKQNIDIR